MEDKETIRKLIVATKKSRTIIFTQTQVAMDGLCFGGKVTNDTKAIGKVINHLCVVKLLTHNIAELETHL